MDLKNADAEFEPIREPLRKRINKLNEYWLANMFDRIYFLLAVNKFMNRSTFSGTGFRELNRPIRI